MSLVADNDGRESLMKMLLSSPLIPLQTTTTTTLSLGGEYTASLSGFPSPMSDSASDELIPSLTNYIHSLSNFAFEEPKIINKIIMEHSYSRAWNWRQESSSSKPARCLLVHKPPLCPGCHEDLEDLYVDVDGPVSPPPPLPYDVERGRASMNEVETHLSDHRTRHEDGDWEDNIDRKHWSMNENSYYTVIKDILHEDLVARLTVQNHRNEPVLRRSIVDRSVSKFRQAFNTVGWDIKTLQWMHNLLIDNLNKKLLSVYLDILQGLKSKLPVLVDKIIFSGVLRNGAISYESLFDLLKKPWDPLGDNVIHNKVKKIPNNPIIFVCPTCPQFNSLLPNRYQQLMTFLNEMATVENVSMNLGFSSSRLTLTQIVEHMLAFSRARLQEVKMEHPDRPIVLLGFHSGASLAFQMAQTEIVTCIICIGFDIHTAQGSRGTPDDIILDIPYPVLFIMGENSSRSHPEEVENLRQKMTAETSLIVIGSADDSLRLSNNKKILEGVTQPMVDRCVMDEIADYVTTILLNPYPTRKQQGASFISTANPSFIKTKQKMAKNKKISKRPASSNSVLDADKKPSSPKRPRPGNNGVGRPKGSVKNKTPQSRNATLQSINNPPPGGITVTMGTICSSPSNKFLDNASSVQIHDARSLNMLASTKVNLASKLNNLKLQDSRQLNVMNPEEEMNQAILSIMPEGSEKAATTSPPSTKKSLLNNNKRSTKNVTPRKKKRSLLSLLQQQLNVTNGVLTSRGGSTTVPHESPSTANRTMSSNIDDVNKYKLPSNIGKPSCSRLVTNSVTLQRYQSNSKFVKMHIPGSRNITEVNKTMLLSAKNNMQKNPAMLNAKSLNDQLAGTNILDIPIIFADNDGNFNEPVKDDNHINTANLVGGKTGKSPITMVVVNQQGGNMGVTQLNLQNINKPLNSTNQKQVLTNNSNSRYPKILLRRSSIQSNTKFNNKLQQKTSPTIDFKNVDLECELVASKVLKTIPPIVKQTKPISVTVSSCNSDTKNQILLTVDSKTKMLKNTLNPDTKKAVIRAPIILKPSAQIKTIPIIKAQNILNKTFTLKKNNVGCNFITGQKLTLQQMNSKDHSDA